MSDDLVRRLSCYADLNDAVYHPWVYKEAADRIKQLEAALRKIALDEPDCCMIADRMKETAEIALGKKDD